MTKQGIKFDNHSKTPWAECLDQALDSDGFAILRATENPLDKTQHRANIQRIVACVNAFEGIDTDRIAGKNLGEFLAGEVRLNKAEPKPDGSFGFTFSGFAVQLMAESMAQQFKESGAINYLELRFQHREIGPITVTMQREEGLTPAQKLAQAEARIQELELRHRQRDRDDFINAINHPNSLYTADEAMEAIAEYDRTH